MKIHLTLVTVGSSPNKSPQCRHCRPSDGALRVKDKAIPLQAWTGPEGSRRLRLPDFKTTGT